MPLALDLKHGDKIIVNGAVIENSGHNTQILVHNDAAILRGKEIMIESSASTPASRAYFALQCAYIFPNARQNYLAAFDELLVDYVKAAPSARTIGHDIVEKLTNNSLYSALKAARKLVAHEKKLMGDLGIEITADGFLATSALKAAGPLKAEGKAETPAAKPPLKVETRKLPQKPRQMPKG
ncbi:MAG TPA: flagellar biosynthesis repressor FlbT [Magnetospirillaceae bacterium]